MAKYFIRTKKEEGNASLYVRFQKYGQNSLINTKVMVNISDWNNAQSNVSKWKSFVNTSSGKKVNELLTKIDSFLDSIMPYDNLTTAQISAKISDIVGYEAKNILILTTAEKARKEAQIKAEEEIIRKNNILLYLDNHIENIKTGIQKNKSGRTMTQNTIHNWCVFRNVLTPYIQNHYFSWADINKSLLTNFVLYLENKKYMDGTINNILQKFSSLVSTAYMEEYHENFRASKIISSAKRVVRVQNKKAEIYLNEQEIQALYEMSLPPYEATIRDCFLIGVYTCQRYSDYKKMNYDQIKTTARGNEVIRIIQEKTQNETVIPLLNENLRTLLLRNTFVQVKSQNNHFNVKIKEILHNLAKDVESLNELYETIPTKSENEHTKSITIEKGGKYYRPKWSLVGTHTARRSGITNMYLSGKLNIIQMMSISGHKTPKMFLDYIKLSNLDIADEIADKMRSENDGANTMLF